MAQVTQHIILQSPTANDPLLDMNTQPSLDLQFSASKTLDDQVSGQNLITFSRSTTGTYVDSSGVIQTAAIDAPRFDHDPATGESLGLLVEESRTNISIYSETPTDSSWAKSNSSVTPNAFLAPNGTTTAAKLIENTATAEHILTTPNSSGSGAFTASVYLRAAERTEAQFLMSDFSTGGVIIHINLSTGASTANTTGSWTSTSSSATAAGNGWYRVSVTGTRSGFGTIRGAIRTSLSGSTTYAGDGTSGIYVWGFQLEAGSFPTSYIPTASSTVTRAADVAEITGSNFSSWYNQSEGTVYIDRTYTGGGQAYYFSDSGLTTNRFRLEGATHAGNNASDGSFYTITVSGDKTAVGLQTDNVSVNGAVSDTSFTMPSAIDRVFLGRHAAGSLFLNGSISRFTYYPYRLGDTKLQEITS